MKVYEICFDSFNKISVLGETFEEAYKQAVWILEKASKTETLQDNVVTFKNSKVTSIIEKNEIFVAK